MKKYLLSAAALVLFATGADASTTYVLNNITYANSFVPSSPVGCTGCGTGTAVDDGAGNITLTGIAWSFAGGGNSYTASIAGSTTLATGTSLVNSGGSCTYISGTDVCDPASIRSGWGQPNFFTGIASDNATSCVNDRCRVDLLLSGSTLTMEVKRALSESATSAGFQKLTFTFAAVPVPAAVWLFGSALGLLAFARRKLA